MCGTAVRLTMLRVSLLSLFNSPTVRARAGGGQSALCLCPENITVGSKTRSRLGVRVLDTRKRADAWRVRTTRAATRTHTRASRHTRALTREAVFPTVWLHPIPSVLVSAYLRSLASFSPFAVRPVRSIPRRFFGTRTYAGACTCA